MVKEFALAGATLKVAGRYSVVWPMRVAANPDYSSRLNPLLCRFQG
jgi:hypothetical protein